MKRYIYYISISILSIAFLILLCYNIIMNKAKNYTIQRIVQNKVLIQNQKKFTKCIIDFNNYQLLQNPELPTGCEVTSLCMVLNSLGENVDKIILAQKFLPKSNSSNNPEKFFIGSPFSISGAGCFVPTLEQTVKNYNSSICTSDLSGKKIEELEQYISNGTPIIIWITIDMQPAILQNKWIENGKEIKWWYYQHCVVLIGFDENKYYIQDPLKGFCSWDKEIVKKRYNQLQKRALLVWK